MLKSVFFIAALVSFQVFAHDDFIAQGGDVVLRPLMMPETVRAYVESEDDLRDHVLNFNETAESYFILGEKLIERNQQDFSENSDKRERVIWGAQLLGESARMNYGPALLKISHFHGPEGADPFPDLCQTYLERAIAADVPGAEDLYNDFVDEDFIE